MARITASSAEKIFQIKAWGGLHQNPDGDTKLKMGEAADMRNFRITRDGNLQRRPGTRTLLQLSETEEVKGLWTGFVNEREVLLAACGGKLWSLWDDVAEDFVQTEIGEIDCENSVHFFGFSGIVYILNGKEYLQWDGENLERVHGYRPLVNISVAPDNTSRETLEQVNKLNGERRMWISPDGEGNTFYLPEKNVYSVDYIKDLRTGEEIYSFATDLEHGTIIFDEPPDKAVNSYEVGWTMEETGRAEVERMRFSELYSGSTDARVFIYGDGSNEAFYSGIDYDGKPRADYFPDMNEMAVGDSNTPITGMIRHYSTLICFKKNSAWSISHSTTTLADGSVIPAFYVIPTNRAIGNDAPGQVQLVLNAPYSLHGSDIYEWRNTSSYTANLSTDERQVKRISDRVYAKLSDFDLEKCVCFDDNYAQEYFVVYNDNAVVYNYAADAWYYYTGINASSFVSFHNELYFGTTGGGFKHMNYSYRSDDGVAIDAYWESGAMSLGADYLRKYAAVLWVGIKPEANSEVYVTVQTDRKSNYTEKAVASSLASFYPASFTSWSFAVNRKPQMERLKIKAKKFVFYKLIFRADAVDVTATILSADIRVRMTGDAK